MSRIYSNHQLIGGVDIFGVDNSVPLKPKHEPMYTEKQISAMKADFEERNKLKTAEPKRANEHYTDLASSKFNIEELEDRFVLSPLKLHDGLYRVEWNKELQDEKLRTQDAWNQFLQGSEWSLPSGPLYYATIKSLYYNHDSNYKEVIGKFKEKLQSDFKKDWMITSTQIKYSAIGLDEIMHDYGSSNPYKIEANLVGQNGQITAQSGFEVSIESLLGTSDSAEVEEVFEWVSGRKSHLWRLNGKPRNDVMQALVLGVIDDDWFDIVAYDNISNYRPARGVVRREISTGNLGKGSGEI